MHHWLFLTIALAAGKLPTQDEESKCPPELIIVASRQRSASSFVTGEMGRYVLASAKIGAWEGPTVLKSKDKSTTVRSLSFGEPFLLPWKGDKAGVYEKHVKGLCEWAGVPKQEFDERHKRPLEFALALRKKACAIACANSTESSCACAAAFKLFNIHTSFTHFGQNRDRSMTIDALKSLLQYPTVRVIVLERQAEAQVCSLAWGDASQKAFNLTTLTFGPKRKEDLKKHYENFKNQCCAGRYDRTEGRTEGCPKPAWFNTQTSDHKHWFGLVRRILHAGGVHHLELRYEEVSSSNPNNQKVLAMARSFAASPGRCADHAPS